MGRQVADFKALPGGSQWCQNGGAIHDCGVRTGTLDLDATWVHENGPGPLNCPAIATICKAHPGIFELSIPGCGGGSFSKLDPCKVGCSCGTVWPGETVRQDNSVFLVRSTQPHTHPVRAAFRRYGRGEHEYDTASFPIFILLKRIILIAKTGSGQTQGQLTDGGRSLSRRGSLP
jgi:hypothetical protein